MAANILCLQLFRPRDFGMDAQKLAKVLALAASDNEAEALHALRTARRLMETHGMDFVEFARRVADGGPAPAQAGSQQAHIEDLEDAVFDLRNEIRHLRAENERLKQSRGPAPQTANDAPNLADAAREAAAAIRLRAELSALKDVIETRDTEILALKAQMAGLHEQAAGNRDEAARLAARVQELEARRLRHEAENRRLGVAATALAAELEEAKADRDQALDKLMRADLARARGQTAEVKAKRPAARTKAKAGANQYALL